MVIGTIFQANLNADHIYIDMTYLPDPITHKFWLTIRNQSLVTLYFKIINNITNWTLTSPADGKLGAVGAGGTGTFTLTMTRAKPGAETTDSGTLVIEAYLDSGYTNLIASDSLSVTVHIEDLETWTDVQKSDFDDGTTQGWTLGPNVTISSDESVEVGGYSAKYYRSGVYTQEAYVSKSIALPNRTNVRVAFFLAYRIYHPTYLAGYARIENLSIYADDTKVFDIPFVIDTVSEATKLIGWIKVAADLSAYKNLTKTIKLGLTAHTSVADTASCSIWFDRIVIAGKD